jgi:hypothetical protein
MPEPEPTSQPGVTVTLSAEECELLHIALGRSVGLVSAWAYRPGRGQLDLAIAEEYLAKVQALREKLMPQIQISPRPRRSEPATAGVFKPT